MSRNFFKRTQVDLIWAITRLIIRRTLDRQFSNCGRSITANDYMRLMASELRDSDYGESESSNIITLTE